MSLSAANCGPSVKPTTGCWNASPPWVTCTLRGSSYTSAPRLGPTSSCECCPQSLRPSSPRPMMRQSACCFRRRRRAHPGICPCVSPACVCVLPLRLPRAPGGRLGLTHCPPSASALRTSRSASCKGRVVTSRLRLYPPAPRQRSCADAASRCRRGTPFPPSRREVATVTTPCGGGKGARPWYVMSARSRCTFQTLTPRLARCCCRRPAAGRAHSKVDFRGAPHPTDPVPGAAPAPPAAPAAAGAAHLQLPRPFGGLGRPPVGVRHFRVLAPKREGGFAKTCDCRRI